MHNIDDICDYVITRLRTGGVFINLLKLHKLLFYIQAWTLAYEKERLFDEDFQAWVHGPVSRKIFDRFKADKSLYSEIKIEDIRTGFDYGSIDQRVSENINSILNLYGGFSGDQLEQLTHEEEPWLEARAGLPLTARSENLISDRTMIRYYSARIA